MPLVELTADAAAAFGVLDLIFLLAGGTGDGDRLLCDDDPEDFWYLSTSESVRRERGGFLRRTLEPSVVDDCSTSTS